MFPLTLEETAASIVNGYTVMLPKSGWPRVPPKTPHFMCSPRTKPSACPASRPERVLQGKCIIV